MNFGRKLIRPIRSKPLERRPRICPVACASIHDAEERRVPVGWQLGLGKIHTPQEPMAHPSSSVKFRRWIRTSTCWLGSPFSSPRPHGLVGTKQIWFGEQRTAAVGWAAFAPNVDTALSPINITAVQSCGLGALALAEVRSMFSPWYFFRGGLGPVTNPSHLELAIRFSRQDTAISMV